MLGGDHGSFRLCRLTSIPIFGASLYSKLVVGSTIADVVRTIGVTQVTSYRWRREYGGLQLDQVKRLLASLWIDITWRGR